MGQGEQTFLLLGNRSREERIRYISRCPVKHLVRHLLQGYAGADNGVSPNGIRDRQHAQGDAVRVLQGPSPAGPFPQEPVRYRTLGPLNRDRPIDGLQPVDDDIPVRRGGMGGKIPGGRDGDLSHAGLVQVALPDIGVVQDGFDVREGINVIGHADKPL